MCLTIVALGLLAEPREECLAGEGVSPGTVGSRRQVRWYAYFSRYIGKTRVSGCHVAVNTRQEGARQMGRRVGIRNAMAVTGEREH